MKSIEGNDDTKISSFISHFSFTLQGGAVHLHVSSRRRALCAFLKSDEMIMIIGTNRCGVRYRIVIVAAYIFKLAE
jgi:hypothetical protein